MLEIVNLHKSFDDREILKGISLNVDDGEIFGFIGHNGAGKTTTIRCAVGILDYEMGQIKVNGIDIKQNPIQAKQTLAFLPDNPDLYENLTGVQYLNYIADIYGMDTSARVDQISEIAKELEIYDHLGDQIKSLSHGMKQKVAVVSAFMHDPKLLILDEPFVGLDPKAAFTLKNRMKRLTEAGGSIFFSSHVLEVVSNLCDRIAILKSGEIVKMGSTSELLASGESLEQLFLETEFNHV